MTSRRRTRTVGRAAFVGSLVEADRFGADPYLVVSARTPHSALTIPGMALSADVTAARRTAVG